MSSNFLLQTCFCHNSAYFSDTKSYDSSKDSSWSHAHLAPKISWFARKLTELARFKVSALSKNIKTCSHHNFLILHQKNTNDIAKVSSRPHRIFEPLILEFARKLVEYRLLKVSAYLITYISCRPPFEGGRDIFVQQKTGPILVRLCKGLFWRTLRIRWENINPPGKLTSVSNPWLLVLSPF